jgi:GH15 family glucan-1,4-alpha-glucosidase
VGLHLGPDSWSLQRHIVDFVVKHWEEPDEGIWEIRGPRQQFTHSKVMAWVAFDRAVKAVERFGFDGPVDTWREVRAQIHEQVCSRGYDAGRNTFVQHYGSKALDASLLLIPLVGFLPPDDARVRGTIERIQRELVVEGLVQRYSTETNVDNLPPGEGTFLPCTFWLVDCLSMTGRRDEAEALFERLLGLRNDLGLLSEEYEPRTQQMLGNFPQALTHMALIHSAHLLSMPKGKAERSSQEGERAANAAAA